MSEKKEKTIEVKTIPLNLNEIKITVVGKSPLVMGKMSEETKKGILDKQTGITKGNKKKVRDIEKESTEAIHKTNDGTIGFPFHGFKAGMMDVTSFIGDKFFSRKLVSGAVQITNVVDGLIPIKFKKQDILEHFINPNTLFSPQFHEWSCELEICYDANNISAQDIMNLLNHAGHYVGVGMWRPKGKDGGSGIYGMYYVK